MFVLSLSSLTSWRCIFCLILGLLSHYAPFSLFGKHPLHQQDMFPPTNSQHICSAAPPCWLYSKKVPRVDVEHVKCYLPHLLGRWIFMGLYAGDTLQAAVQTASSSHRTGVNIWHATPSSQKSPSCYIFRGFRISWQFFLVVDHLFLFAQHTWGAALGCEVLWDESS